MFRMRRRGSDVARGVVADLGGWRLLALAAGLAFYVLWTFSSWGGADHRQAIGDTLFAIVSGWAFLACRHAARQSTGRVARGWWLLGIGVGMYVLGDFVQFVREVMFHNLNNPA